MKVDRPKCHKFSLFLQQTSHISAICDIAYQKMFMPCLVSMFKVCDGFTPGSNTVDKPIINVF